MAAAGPPRFRCPEDFCARRFVPRPALSPEALRAPARQLLLIRAPADFSPESLEGHTVPLFGTHVVKASQPDGIQKVYGLQMSREDTGSSPRLLIPSDRPDHLTCAPPFGGSLNIWERYGDCSAAWPLFSVADRPVPQVPEGLKQRFFPFGGRPKRPPPSSGAPEKTSWKKSKKRQLQTPEDGPPPEQQLPLKPEPWEVGSPEELPGGFTGPAGGLPEEQTRAGHKRCPLKGEVTEEAALPAVGAGGQMPGQDAQLSSHLEEGLLLGEAGYPAGRKSSKKKKKPKKRVEAEELLGPNSRDQQPKEQSWLQEEREPEGGGGDHAGEPALGQRKRKKKKKQQWETVAEGLWDVAAVKESPEDIGCWGSAKQEPGGERPSCKKKKKKKRKGGEEPPKEQGTEAQPLEQSSIVPGWDASGVSLWQEAGPEEPVQPDGAAPNQKHKKERRRRKEGWAGLSTAGT